MNTLESFIDNRVEKIRNFFSINNLISTVTFFKKPNSRIVSNKKEWNKLLAKNLLNDSSPTPNVSPRNTEEEEEDHYSLLQEVIETSTEELLTTIEEVNRK